MSLMTLPPEILTRHSFQSCYEDLICPRRLETRLCELDGVMGSCPQRLVSCGVDVTEVAVAAFDVVEVVDVIARRRGPDAKNK